MQGGLGVESKVAELNRDQVRLDVTLVRITNTVTQKNKLRGLGPLAKYTDRANAACERN
jgi:hypothetical protein